MAQNVFFKIGTAAQYSAATKDSKTFYYTTDNNKVYLGNIELSTPAGVAAAIELVNDESKGNEALYSALNSLIERVGQNSDLTTTDKDTIVGAINELKSAIDTINDSTNGILKKAKDYADTQDTALETALENKIGDLDDLTTDDKSNLVEAINEIDAAVDALETSSEVTIEKTEPEGVAARYTIKQGGTALPVTIDIPKDMVVKEGSVVKNPAGQPEGTYIKLVLANATNDTIYVNVGTLVDIYTAKQSATQVQLAIDSSTREISATIVGGSITDAELAANAVKTVKIEDKAVTKAKLAQAVQDTLDAADSALQKADITTGSANGTIAVKGTDVAVKGLGSAAYTASTAYDAAGSANTAEQNAKDYTDTALTWQSI